MHVCLRSAWKDVYDRFEEKNYSYLRSTWKDARGEKRGRAHFERALATGGFWSVLSVPISSNLGIFSNIQRSLI